LVRAHQLEKAEHGQHRCEAERSQR
jgi:hypothetical protein